VLQQRIVRAGRGRPAPRRAPHHPFPQSMF